jgi:hypothetical protein
LKGNTSLMEDATLLLSWLSGHCHLGSKDCHAAATRAPTLARQTMETAGMQAAATPKCLNAKTCDSTSMTKVRLDASSLFDRNRRTSPSAKAPPRNGKRKEIATMERKHAAVEDPATTSVEDALAAPLVTKIMVAASPRLGHTFRMGASR